MAGSINEVTLLGNLARDVEMRTTQAGKQIANLTIATSEQWKDASGERKEKSEFHRVVIFNEALAKIAGDYLRKGSKTLIRGQLQTRKWTDKDGVEKYSTEIVLQGFDAKLVLLDGKKADEDRGGYGEPRQSPREDARRPAAYEPESFSDEIPFAWAIALLGSGLIWSLTQGGFIA